MKTRVAAMAIGIAILTLVLSLSASAVESSGPNGVSAERMAPDLPRTPYPDSWPPAERPLNGWTELLREDFEGRFPDGWTTSGWPDYKFWKRDCRHHEGSYSAWCIGRSLADVWTPCDATCPAGQYPHLVWGPFSLVQAAYAEARFFYWLDADHSMGSAAVYASLDGQDYYGVGLSQTTEDGCPDGWCEYVFDFRNAGSLGNICGAPEVWLRFGFSSRSDGEYQGLFVDDVLIRAWVGDNPPTPTTTPTLCKTPPWHPTCTPTFTPKAHATCTPTSTPRSATATPTASITPGPSPTPSATWEVHSVLYLPVVFKHYPE